MTPPYGPVLLAVDKPMQEGPIPPGRGLKVTPLPRMAAPQAEDAALLSDADIADLMAYLRTTPKSPPAADIPILRNAPG